MVYIMSEHFHYGQTTTPDLSKPPPPPAAAEAANCPRCGSTNTKICYYNNYNKSQPRHLCKSCKRHWTRGGALRNIPADRRRRNKRPRTSAAYAPPQGEHLLNRPSFSTDHNYTSGFLYKSLARSSSPQSTILESSSTTCAASAAPQNHQSTDITFTSIPTSNDRYCSGASTWEEPAMATSAAPPWTAELWKWDSDIEFLGAVLDDFDAYKLTHFI